MFYLGMDIAKAKLDCCLLLNETGDKRKSKVIPNTQAGVTALLEWTAKQGVSAAQLHVVMDATGRILVPPALRRYAQLDKAVVLVGQGHKFELWNKDHWDELMEKGAGPGAGGLPPELEGFSL